MIRKTVNQIAPETRHTRQVFLQILLPILLTVALVLLVGVLVIVTSSAKPVISQQLAHISLIFLLLPMIMIGVIQLTLLVLACVGMQKANSALPPSLKRVRLSIQKFGNSVQEKATQITNSVVKTGAAAAGFKSLFTKIKRPN
jgi:hypothetical protein